MRLRTTLTVLRSGAPVARLKAFRDGQAAMRIALVGAALELGVLDALSGRTATTRELVDALAANDVPMSDVDLFDAYLQVLAAAGLVDLGGSRWRLTRKSRSIMEDDVARASYEAFSGYHVGLYRDLGAQLAGGPARRDITERGEVIARLSKVFEPFVAETLTELAAGQSPAHVLDIGCGAGRQLVTLLRAAPLATGTGIDTDPGAAALAEEALEREGLSDRARILVGDAREMLASGERIGTPVDLALLANAIYYVPVEERVGFLREIAGVLAPGGLLVTVSTVIGPALFSRHFDLLLRAQAGQMELPVVEQLTDQLRAAGLEPEEPRRIAAGEPLMAFVATKPL
ncbi:MAG TPA: class I SAM-dependent methyltransferase [Nocardioidaceae bacterium]|nr:class I SAM-dependent methyltransferase [Nocardioidaceae bacterium]